MNTLDAPLDPCNANRYALAATIPISHVDPTGRYSPAAPLGYAITPFLTATGAFLGGLAGGAPPVRP